MILHKIYKKFGFSLVEISIVIFVIFILLASAFNASNFFATANVQSVVTKFILPWQKVFFQYQSKNYIPLGSNASLAINRMIGGALNVIIANDLIGRKNNELTNLLIATNIDLGLYFSTNTPDQIVVNDENGNQLRLRAGFATVSWYTQTGSGTASQSLRDVLVIHGLNSAYASEMDVIIDGISNPQRGRFRSQAASTLNGFLSPTPWSSSTAPVIAYFLL